MAFKKRSPPDIDRLKRAGDINGLVQALSYPEPDCRQLAIRTLAETGIPVIRYLLPVFLDTDDEYVMDGAGSVIRELGTPALRPLKKILANKDPKVRASAATALGFLGESAEAVLVPALDDPSWDVKCRAVQSLKKTRWSPTEEQDRQNVIYNLVLGELEAVVRIKKTAFPYLIPMLDDPDYHLQVEAIKALGRIKSGKAVAFLIKTLRNDETAVRSAVIDALGEIGDPRAVPALIRAMADPAPNVRAESVFALEKIGWLPKSTAEKIRYLVAKNQWADIAGLGTSAIPSIIAALTDTQTHVRIRLASVLSEMGTPAIQALERARRGSNRELARAAHEALCRIRDEPVGSPASGSDTVSWVMEDTPESETDEPDTPYDIPEKPESAEEKVARISVLLADPDPTIRVTAVENLRVIGNPALKPLVGALKDTDRNVRVAAAESLGSLNNPRVVPFLLHLLRKDPEKEVRRAAAESLGKIRDSSAIPPLITACNDPDPLVRAAVATALGTIGTPALPAILARTGDPRVNVKNTLLLALGEMTAPAAVRPLIEAFDDPNPVINKTARIALLAFAQRSIHVFMEASPLFIAKGSRNVRLGLLETLAWIDTEHALWLIRAMRFDPDEEIRNRSIELFRLRERQWLKNHKTVSLSPTEERAVLDLIASLSAHDRAVREEAAGKLILVGAPAIPHLLSSLPGQRRMAWECIDEIIGSLRETAVEDLIEAVQDKSPLIRTTVVRHLSELSHDRAQEALGWILYSEEDPDIRRIAVRGLGKPGNSAGISPLVHILKNDPENKSGAILSLATIGSRTALDVLVDCLDDEGDEMIPHVAGALGSCGDDCNRALADALLRGDSEFRSRVARVMDLVKWQPRDTESLIRYYIAKGAWPELKKIGAPARDFLISALNNPDESTRRNVAQVIAYLGDITLAPLVAALADENPLVREGAARTLGYLGRAAISPLEGALKDPCAEVRSTAAESLDRLEWKPRNNVKAALYYRAKKDWDALVARGAEVVPLLVRTLRDPDSGIRVAAVNALGAIHDERAVPYLISMTDTIDDPATLHAVIAAFGSMEDEKTLAFLERSLANPVFSLRTAAAQALKKRGWIPSSDAGLAALYIAGEEPREIARMGSRAIPHLLAMLTDDQVMNRLVITESLMLMGDAGRSALELVIGEGDPRMQEIAREILAVLQTRQNELPPVAIARTGNPARESVLDLHKERLSRMTPRQIRESLSDPDENIRMAAADLIVDQGDEAIDPLMNLLADPSDAVRIVAIYALGRLSAKKAVPLLLPLLGDLDEEVRIAVSASLGKTGDPSVIPDLVRCFSDTVPTVRTSAAYALAAFGSDALVPLLDAAEDEWPEVRAAGLESLGAMSVRIPLYPFIKSLGDQNEMVRLTAIRTLGDLAKQPGIPVLPLIADIIAEGDPLSRTSALEILARVRDLRALDLLRLAATDESETIRFRAREILRLAEQETPDESADDAIRARTDEEIKSLIQDLAQDRDKTRAYATKTLLHMGTPVVRPLLASLNGADPGFSSAIMNVLEQMGAYITDNLIEALQDESAPVRQVAIILLAKTGTARADLALGHALYAEPDPRLKKTIAEVLGTMGMSHGVKPLLDALSEPDLQVRLAVIRSLGILKDGEAAEQLVGQLGDKDNDEISYAAGESLRQLGNAARLPLIRALSRGDHFPRAKSAEILADIDCIPRDPTEQAYYLIARERWYDLEAIGTPALVPLAEILSDPHDHLRLGAVNAVIKIGGEASVPPLVVALNDPSPIVQKRAENALRALGTPAFEPLVNALFQGQIRTPAVAERIIQAITTPADSRKGPAP